MLALRRTLILSSVLGAVLALGGPLGNAAVPSPAPALTVAQLAALQAVTSWDYTYSFDSHEDYTNSGGSYIAFAGGEVSAWSFAQHFARTVTATGTFTGPAGCTFVRTAPFEEQHPCHIDPTLPNHATIHDARTTTGRWSAPQACAGAPLTDGVNDSSFEYSGSVHIDPSSAGRAHSGFGIYYDASPPRGEGAVIFDGLNGTGSSTSGGCAQSQTETHDAQGTAGISFSFGDTARCCALGDTQVTVDQRGLVIKGQSQATQVVNTCLLPVSAASGIFPCLTTGTVAPDTTTSQASWTLRPHVDGLDVAAIEVNQVVQDWRNTVPLTEGKPTIARVFMTWHGEHPHTTTALLYGTRDGAPLPGSPLAPMNGTISATDDPLAERDSLNGSLNYLLPASWTKGSVTLEAKLREEDSTQLNCSEAAAPSDDCQAKVDFTPVSPLQVKLVAITWTHAGSGGITETTPFSALANEAQILRNLLPAATIDWTTGYLNVGVAADTDLEHVERATNSKLKLMRAADGCGVGCNRIYVGVLFDGASDIGEASAIPGTVASVFFSNVPGDRSRNVVAHEVGHDLGREHDTLASLGPWVISGKSYPQGPCEEVSSPGSTDYPWFGSFPDLFTILKSTGVGTQPGLRPLLGRPGAAVDDEVWGLDTSALFSDPSGAVLPPTEVWDLMGYCDSEGAHEDEWPSAHTYRALRDALNALFPAAPTLRRVAVHRVAPTEQLIVRGTVDLRSGTVDYDAAFPAAAAPPPATGAYALEARDGNGALLASVPLDLTPPHVDGTPPPAVTVSDPFVTGRVSFVAAVPVGTAALQLLDDQGAAVGTAMSASAHAPSVSVTRARFDSAAATIDVAWSASDADGDPLRATVEYSADGNTWQTLGVDVAGNSYTISAAASSASSAARVRVIVSDGLRTGSADSAPFTVGNRGPQIAIVAPVPLTAVPADRPVSLSALAFDAEDGPVNSVQWSVDGRPLGNGATLALAAGALGDGRCLSASVTDTGGLSATAAIPLGAGGVCAAPAGPSSPPSSSPSAPTAPTAPTAPATPPITLPVAPPLTLPASAQTSLAAPTLAARRVVMAAHGRSVTRLSVRVTVAAASSVEVRGVAAGRAIVFKPGSRVAGSVTGKPHTLIASQVDAPGSFLVQLLVSRRHAPVPAQLSFVAVGLDGKRSRLSLHVVIP